MASIERLTAEVWGDDPPASSAHTLAAYVSRLRSTLTEHDIAIERRGNGYCVTLDAAYLDAGEFEHLAAAAARAFVAGDHARVSALAREATDLWRGDALSDVELHDRARAEIERLEEARLTTLELRMEADLALGRDRELVGELRALVDAHPYRERFVAQLMLALYRAGRQADALEVYETTRERLVAELGLQPSRALQQLSGEIVRQESRLLLPPPDAEERPPEDVDVGAARPLPRSNRTLFVSMLAGVVAAAVAIPILALGQGERKDSEQVGTVLGNSLSIVDPRSAHLLANIPVGTAPTDVAFGAGAAWVANAGDGTVDRIDLATRSVRQTIRVGSSPSGVVVGEGFVWVVDGLEGTLSRIDPESSEVTQRIAVGNGPSGLAVGGGRIWVVNRDDHTLVAVDPESGDVVERTHAGSDPVDVAVGDGVVWLTNGSAGTVLQLDQSSGRTLDTVGVGKGPGAVVAAAGSVWVANTLDGTVSRIDPATSTVTSTIEVGEGPHGIAAVGGSVWVTTEFGGSLIRIDPETNGVTSVPVDGRPAGVTGTSAGLLVAIRAEGDAHVGGTLKVALGVGSIDMAATGESWEVLGLTNDGLTAFRRIGGQAGSQIVPNLAAALPRPVDGGRTYVFKLRSGIRYSTGRPVRPGDVRHSLERLFELRSPNAFTYRSIVGAAMCLRRPRPCDLSRGIVVDPRVRTVTFHLTEPDPDLPAKLALPYAFVIPQGTPSRVADSHPLPATGPYVVASYVPGRQLRLVRNPQFRDRPRAARPTSYPDEIVATLDRTVRQQILDVSREVTDVTNVTGTTDLADIRRRYASRLHSTAWQALIYVFLNTETPPFDDVRVRQALNHAVDRGLAVESYGGAERAAASCQLLPPNFPGYQRYCPYDRDLAAASELVADSGTRGSTVVVWASASSAPWLRPVVAALRSLGYRARLQALPDEVYFDRVQAEGNAVQAGFFGWMANYASAADFVVPFTCREKRSGSVNLSNLCDSAVERRVRRARAVQAADPSTANELWAGVDRTITDLAPLVPLFNPRAAHFVSTRVGNYQFNPVMGALLDQMWVR